MVRVEDCSIISRSTVPAAESSQSEENCNAEEDLLIIKASLATAEVSAAGFLGYVCLVD